MTNTVLKETRCPHDISEALGIPLQKSMEMVRKAPFELIGWGAAGKQEHIISRRRSMSHWPEADELRIHYYRKLHDQGRVNLCQGRDGDFFLLYALPNATPVKRDTYFYSERGH